MWTTFLGLVLLMASPQVEISKTFKKEMTPLQSGVDSVITSTGSQLLQRSRAAYIEEYGIVVTLEVAFEGPQNPFSGYKTSAEMRTLVEQRRKDLQEELTAFLKQRVSTMDSIAPAESLTIVIHVLDTNPGDVKNLPVQIVMTAKKDSSQPIAVRVLL